MTQEVKRQEFEDPVHGRISLHPLCVRLLDTPHFQRLKSLRQLSTVVFVRPKATHTRFDHSLGTSHLAWRLVHGVRKRQPNLPITDVDQLCVEVAALCHALGHAPFSHLWPDILRKGNKEHGYKPEEMTLKLFDHLLQLPAIQEQFRKYGLGGRDLDFIKALLWPLQELRDKANRDPKKQFLYDVVANQNSGIDVDRWDCYLRDAHGLGMSVSFDLEPLLEMCKALDTPSGWQLCYPAKDVDNLYELCRTRVLLHKKGRQHHSVKIIDGMITEAFILADESITYHYQGEQVKLSEAFLWEHLEVYLKMMTDDVFSEVLRCGEGGPRLSESKKLLNRVLNRELYKDVVEKLLPSNEPWFRQLFNDKAKFDKEKEKLEHSLRISLRHEIPGAREDNWILQISVLNYGNSFRNPLSHQHFFREASTTPFFIDSEQVSWMLPTVYQDVRLRLVAKELQEAEMATARRAASQCYHTWESNLRRPH